jgi:uncharacterized membrane protein YphA (DoxX/SURF4 family)
MPSTTQTASGSKKGLWAGRNISALPALFLLVDAVMKLVKPAPAVEATVGLGYSDSTCATPAARTHSSAPGRTAIMNVALWIIQILLALPFLFAGGTKLVLPIETLISMGSPNQMLLPGLLLRAIGVCEVLGAIGLILPGLLRTRPGLTPLAAAGLVIIMIGATVLTFVANGFAMAQTPLVAGLLAAFVAYGRWRLAPHRGR